MLLKLQESGKILKWQAILHQSHGYRSICKICKASLVSKQRKIQIYKGYLADHVYCSKQQPKCIPYLEGRY